MNIIIFRYNYSYNNITERYILKEMNLNWLNLFRDVTGGRVGGRGSVTRIATSESAVPATA